MESYIYYDMDYPTRFGPFMEEWRGITGYERYYQISNYGRLKALRRYYFKKKGVCVPVPERIHSNLNSRSFDWYIKYTLCVDSKMKYVSAHVLVAQHFIENANDKPEVNHIDGFKSNPFVGNLEWVTPSENHLHAYRTGLQNPYQSKIILDTSTGIYFDNIKQAEKSMGFYRNKLSKMLLNKLPNNTSLIAV